MPLRGGPGQLLTYPRILCLVHLQRSQEVKSMPGEGGSVRPWVVGTPAAAWALSSCLAPGGSPHPHFTLLSPELQTHLEVRMVANVSLGY